MVRRWLRKYFIPHPGNDHQPHLLRLEAVLGLLGIVLIVELLFLAEAFVLFENARFLATIVESAVLDATNESRVSEELPALALSPLLGEAARLKAEDMASRDYFAHTSPEGVTPWDWFTRVGYSYAYAGENLAVNFRDSRDVVSAWMNSPSHRENIVNARYAEIGIGTAHGTYKGRDAVFVVQLFGKPLTPVALARAVAAPLPASDVRPSAPSEPSSVQEPVATASPAASATPPPVEPQPAPAREVVRESPAPPDAVLGISQVRLPAGRQGLPRLPTSLMKKLLGMPRTLTNWIYLGLIALVAVGILLTIFIPLPQMSRADEAVDLTDVSPDNSRRRGWHAAVTGFIRFEIQHPHLLAHGVAFLLVVASVLLLNYYVAVAEGQIF